MQAKKKNHPNWIGQPFARAACFSDVSIESVYARIEKIALQFAFDELSLPGEVQQLARDAIGQWEDARTQARTQWNQQHTPV